MNDDVSPSNGFKPPPPLAHVLSYKGWFLFIMYNVEHICVDID